jgi:alpha,alpha-trehalase
MKARELLYESYEPDAEALREALCTVGNGYFATRGAAPESTADGVHYPGTYIAGVYNRLVTSIAGEQIENESLVNAPNWLALSFRIDDGDWFDLADVEILAFRQALDLKQAILQRSVRFRDRAGRTTQMRQRRLVSMDRPHIGVLETRVQAEDWSGRAQILSALDGRVRNSGVARYRDLDGHHLQAVDARVLSAEAMSLEMQTSQSHVRIAEAARTRLWLDDEPCAVEPVALREDDYVAQRFTLQLARGSSVRVEKVVALYTSHDRAISAPGHEARRSLGDCPGYTELARRHALAWSQVWQRFDFDLEHRDPDQAARTDEVLSLHLLHLVQTTSPHVMDLDVGVPARGLHGEAYRGHVFWDELFVFPLFNLRMPEITRTLLRYRHRRLGEARRAARRAGYRGALYPWQSGSNGREESQRLHLNPESGNWIADHSHLQRHINAAVAYNVWQYFQVTRDTEFLSFYGAEMIVEIARLWAGIARQDERSGRWGIHGVMGPDEYHDAYPGARRPGLDNNAYTNVMAVWVLQRALELRELLPARRFDEVCATLDLSPGELALWDAISRNMRVPFHDDGIISQFEGYDELEEFDWQGYRDRYSDIQRLDRILESEGDSPNRYKVSKQADVLMLFYLFSAEELEALFTRLGYPFDADTIPRNIDYYLQRTAHGSTLSRVVHSWVLARANRPGGWPLFVEALESDVSDIQGGTTHEGIHTGAMAGTVDLVQRCFTGIETRGDVLWLNPYLPQGLQRLRQHIRYRRYRLDLEVTPDRIEIGTQPCSEPPMRVGIRGEVHQLAPGEVRVFRL